MEEVMRGGLGIGRMPDYAASEKVKAEHLVVLFSDVTGIGRKSWPATAGNSVLV
jgi:hypothetical protein